MILVFGSINVDLIFRVDAFPQPGETALSQTISILPGGKGANTAVAAARAGAETRMFGCVGTDDFAETALNTMCAAGVDLNGVARSDRPTGCAAVWLDRRGENAIVVASGANQDVAASQIPDALLGDRTIVALQMEVPPAENWAVAERATKAGAKVILNLAPARPVPGRILGGIDVLIANQNETAELASSLGLEKADPADAARMLADRYGTACIVTLGREGVVGWGTDGGWKVPALPVNAIDTTGAGDAFCGGLAAALDRGLDMETALRHASVGAGLACGTEGAQTGAPGRTEIEARLTELPELRRIS